MLGFSNAKINLGLNIVEKRSDGYHNIESVFYPVRWADILEVLPADTSSFTASGLAVPGENLILKAWALLASPQNVKIHLHKVLPMGAGIGGGSSNAAFTLKLVNQVLGLGLSSEALQSHAAKLGSDCPFFIRNTPAYCYGTGTQFEALPPFLKGKYVIMVNPGIHISTAEAYAGIIPQKPAVPVREVVQQPVETWKRQLINDFEAPAIRKYPLLGEIKETFYRHGALYASMTGSGSTLYGIWEKETDLKGLFPSLTYYSGPL